MKRTDLLVRLAAEARVTKSQAERVLNLFLREISVELKKGRSVRATGFGTFSIPKKRIRVRRHLAKKAEVNNIKREIVEFKPGKTLVHFLRERESGSDH